MNCFRLFTHPLLFAFSDAATPLSIPSIPFNSAAGDTVAIE
jgi:hypothetical protein